MQNVEIEKQVNLLFMLKCKRMSLSKTAKLSGYSRGAVENVDLRKRIKYLEAQVAYYEELSKLEGLDLKVSSKKNGSGQSSSSLKEESEQ